GELWAIPIMLRLALIENLRRVGAYIAEARNERNLADSWVDKIAGIAESDPKSVVLVIADMARSNPPMTTAFVSELARRLHGQGATLTLPLTWIEQRLAESNQTVDQMVQLGNQQQAADQVSVSNSINSLRTLGAIDWREFVESVSIVEQTLREDPAGIYGAMEFASRDMYRHVVERVAKVSPMSEGQIARAAVELARDSARDGQNGSNKEGKAIQAHVGFYLIDRGLTELTDAVQVRLSTEEKIQKTGRRHPLLFYLGAIALIVLGLVAGLLARAGGGGVEGWLLVAVGALSIVVMSQLAVALVNWAALFLVKPRALARMDFSKGIPSPFRTLVVIPTLLTSKEEAQSLAEALEVRFLANQDDNLLFGLLTDFADAERETLPEDAPLLDFAGECIEELNARYAKGGDGLPGEKRSAPACKESPFFLFHRPRRWNPSEGLWMGYERKRGKLADLNALLRGAGDDAFSAIIGEKSLLAGIKYVITLDTDTQLPRNSAREFVGTMAHPLNQPRLELIDDECGSIVTGGYGILQPRVGVSLSSTNRSLYAWLFGGEAGIDPYTRVTSDIYQDIFHEGSFVGKGIYDVDAFERALCIRFPENRILSHDLLEGSYARAGLLSDVQLYEEFPSGYLADVKRRHRWIRGDWQLATWLLWRVPAAGHRYQPNPLSSLSRWKLLDNLRRSLVPPASTFLLLLGWIALPDPWFWTLVVVGAMLIPAIIPVLSGLFRKPVEVPWRQQFAMGAQSARRHLGQMLFMLACLPFEAYFSLDAIIRTHVRLLITHRKLLEWSPSREVERLAALPQEETGISRARFFREMWVAPAVAIAGVVGVAVASPWSLIVALPILVLWGGSPALAWWISRPLPAGGVELSSGQIDFLREVARRTWFFFETFHGPDDNWLPPDNFQEIPSPIIAHRTSPTNMGLALLANAAAYDFGYIGLVELIERINRTMKTMGRMERYEGHFYNWYNTQTLVPLSRYISSVDSGNLAAHLLTLRVALLHAADAPIIGERLFPALHDTSRVLSKAIGGKVTKTLAEFDAALSDASAIRPITLSSIRSHLQALATLSGELVHEMLRERPALPSEAQEWARRLHDQCEKSLRELALLLPQPLPAEAPDESETATGSSAGTGIPSLRELANSGSKEAQEQLELLEHLAFEAADMAQMEYGFLFNPARRQLAIGYNAGENRLDSSYYDLLASEARLCNFIAIAQEQLPQESWFALGRMLTSQEGEAALLSWSGSMFEYLMPLLVMPTFDNTLLDQTYKAAVDRQISYGKERNVPWGISESGYNAVDIHFNYQYRAFGVPGLGLKRGLGEDLVIAPYASVLALMVAPEPACRNLQRLTTEGLAGKFGFYEAVDYTPSRLRPGETRAIIRSYMAHHQGMSLLSLVYALLDRPMQTRFESEPLFQATMLLLQERIPKPAVLRPQVTELPSVRIPKELPEMPTRILHRPGTPIPEV
ncbi:MAG TPA: glucoamylase family protein, partial [Nitrosospira sp.]|nr:glucoamylase family protein [Nitrosospira sp.]